MNMKLTPAIHNLIFTAVLFFTFSTSYGQGFFISNHETNLSLRMRVKVLSNGYEMQSFRTYQELCLNRQLLSPEGMELDWNYECDLLPDDNLIGWLQDDTVLVATNSYLETEITWSKEPSAIPSGSRKS